MTSTQHSFLWPLLPINTPDGFAPWRAGQYFHARWRSESSRDSIRCKSLTSPRRNVKPASFNVSRFSGVSLVSAHTPEPMASQGKGQAFQVGRQNKCGIGENFFQRVSGKPTQQFDFLTLALPQAGDIIVSVASIRRREPTSSACQVLERLNEKVAILLWRKASEEKRVAVRLDPMLSR